MNYVSQAIVYGLAFLDTIIAAFGTLPAAKLVATAKLRLSSDPGFNPTPNSTIAQLSANEAAFSGYTAGGYAFATGAALHLNQNTEGTVVNQLVASATATPYVSGNVYGYWIDDGTNVIAGERFAGGAVAGFGAPGDYLDLAVRLPLTGLPLAP